MAEFLSNITTDVCSNTKITCPYCSSINENDSNFCYSCGGKLPHNDVEHVNSQENTARVEKINNVDDNHTLIKKHIEIHVPTIEVDEESIFAKDLPEWNIEPPQLPVRRVRGK